MVPVRYCGQLRPSLRFGAAPAIGQRQGRTRLDRQREEDLHMLAQLREQRLVGVCEGAERLQHELVALLRGANRRALLVDAEGLPVFAETIEPFTGRGGSFRVKSEASS